MKNIEVKKWYFEACQALDQMVSSFTAYLNQLESQLPLPISKPQRARDLLHKIRPNISQKIIRLANVPTRRFEMETLAIRIEETTCDNRCQTDPFELPTQGVGRAQLPFRERLIEGSLLTLTTVQANTQATLPAVQEHSKTIKCYNCGMVGHILRNCGFEAKQHPDRR